VNCSGADAASSWASCYVQAGKACGATGYDIVSKDNDEGGTAAKLPLHDVVPPYSPPDFPRVLIGWAAHVQPALAERPGPSSDLPTVLDRLTRPRSGWDDVSRTMDAVKEDHSDQPKRDLAIALTASAGILGAVLGANAFDIATAAPVWARFYRIVIAAWALAVLMLALATYLGSGKTTAGPPSQEEQLRLHRLRVLILIYLVPLAVATFVALATAGFGYTRDTDHVRLSLSTSEFDALNALCGARLEADRIIGTVRVQTEQQQFVIFDFSHRATISTCTHGVEIPAGQITAIEEDPSPSGT
jgi:hypothetical protein